MLFNAIYQEEEAADSPFAQELVANYPSLPLIQCKHYGEVFNRRSQNFRLQKKAPAIILAKKHSGFVLPTPPGYGIGTERNYYFSHMYNCIYDCRYCFLQGMYSSANYVLFVNFNDFASAIDELIQESDEPATFFSGYDCDSLALEKVTGFASRFVDWFEGKNAFLELRTKSLATSFLLKRKPLENVIVAYTLTPPKIAEALEHRVPPFEKRLKRLQELSEAGWPIGLRFDPLIYCRDYQEQYRSFFAKVFQTVQNVHSVTMGPFRGPKNVLKKMGSLYPEEPLFAQISDDDVLLNFCKEEVLQYIPREKLFIMGDES